MLRIGIARSPGWMRRAHAPPADNNSGVIPSTRCRWRLVLWFRSAWRCRRSGCRQKKRNICVDAADLMVLKTQDHSVCCQTRQASKILMHLCYLLAVSISIQILKEITFSHPNQVLTSLLWVRNCGIWLTQDSLDFCCWRRKLVHGGLLTLVRRSSTSLMSMKETQWEHGQLQVESSPSLGCQLQVWMSFVSRSRCELSQASD
mmetsp:Transcript_55200/g.131559  ORF Transcript_55200/g.131559 Transcript_55200/m.131559 type:complete len:203 (+) Transcript_55200:203-811(+)